MNFLFGLIPAAGMWAIIAYLWYARVISRKVAVGLATLTLFVFAFMSAQTYGPRNGLTAAATPYAPEPVPVTTGSKMVEPKDRIGQFDQKLSELESLEIHARPGR